MTRRDLLVKYESINKFTYEHLLPLTVGVALVNAWLALVLDAIEASR